MWDVHMHCRYSADSTAEPKDMVEAAMKQGLDGICFTDHEDLDYPKMPDEPDYLVDFASYFPEMDALREKYEGKIEIRRGVEVGLQSQVAAQNKQIVENYPFDFVIGSVHVINGKDPYYPSFFESRSEIESFEEYFRCTLENIHVFSDFDVLGHIGYLVRYAPHQKEYYDPANYQDMLDEILKYLVERGKGIECNTSGYAFHLGSPIPGEKILRRYKELGGEILTIGADAHVPENVGGGFKETRELLLECGFHYYTVFSGRKAQFLPL